MPENQEHEGFMSEIEDKGFEKAVTAYLSEGLHTRRGLTTKEYTTLCRRAWEKCHASPAFPFKILIDPLRPVQDVLKDGAQSASIGERLMRSRPQREPSTEVRCEAVGCVKPDLSTGPTTCDLCLRMNLRLLRHAATSLQCPRCAWLLCSPEGQGTQRHRSLLQAHR